MRVNRYIPDEKSMLALGADLAAACPEGAVIYFEGELGAGKTTLVRGLLHALGHLGVVKSPTYTLVEPYLICGRRLYHFDLYRLGDPEELEYIGSRDYFSEEAVCLVEWPERGQGQLPAPDLRLSLSFQGKGRDVLMKAERPAGEVMLQSLIDA